MLVDLAAAEVEQALAQIELQRDGILPAATHCAADVVSGQAAAAALQARDRLFAHELPLPDRARRFEWPA